MGWGVENRPGGPKPRTVDPNRAPNRGPKFFGLFHGVVQGPMLSTFSSGASWVHVLVPPLYFCHQRFGSTYGARFWSTGTRFGSIGPHFGSTCKTKMGPHLGRGLGPSARFLGPHVRTFGSTWGAIWVHRPEVWVHDGDSLVNLHLTKLTLLILKPCRPRFPSCSLPGKTWVIARP